MSALENRNYQGAEAEWMTSDVLGAVHANPSLIKDRGIKYEVVRSTLSNYGKVLREKGVPPEEVQAKVDATEETLSKTPRNEVVVFATNIHVVANSSGRSSSLKIRQT